MDKSLLKWDFLEDFIKSAYVAYGVPEKDAEICTTILLESDRRGIPTHGVNRLKPVYLDRIAIGIQEPVTNITLLKETPTTAVLDGGNGMGMVVAHHAMELAIKKAKEYGMGMVAVRNSTHYGIAGYYLSMATEADCIGITGTNARPSIAPTFSVQNKLGTNPLALGVPTDEPFPFLLDCATSIIQRGRIEVYDHLGKTLPPNLVIGPDGQSMTDPGEILKGLSTGRAALAPLGGIGDETAGYKGYGFATFTEILSAALQDGKYLSMLTGKDENGDPVPIPLGHYFIAINTDAFMGAAVFKRIAGSILRELRAAKKAPGHDRIYTAGEKEYLAKQATKDTGVSLNEALQKEFIAVRDSKPELARFRFPFE